MVLSLNCVCGKSDSLCLHSSEMEGSTRLLCEAKPLTPPWFCLHVDAWNESPVGLCTYINIFIFKFDRTNTEKHFLFTSVRFWTCVLVELQPEPMCKVAPDGGLFWSAQIVQIPKQPLKPRPPPSSYKKNLLQRLLSVEWTFKPDMSFYTSPPQQSWKL